MPAMAILGVDVGGTFTDAVLLADGRLTTAKVPTGPRQEQAVIEAAQAVLAGAGEPRLERFAHGTTVATNALLERTGARTAFVATEGFEHLLHLRRQGPRAPVPPRRAPPGAARPARAVLRRA